MFYVLIRVDEGQFTIGDRVMVLADFSGITAGEKGIVTEVYEGGVVITWERMEKWGKSVIATPDYMRAISNSGLGFPISDGWRSDGFSRKELKYLAIETKTLPAAFDH